MAEPLARDGSAGAAAAGGTGACGARVEGARIRFPRLGEPVTAGARPDGWPRLRRGAGATPAAPEGGGWPRISVVTPTLDQAGTLEETILSVAHQDYPAVEHLVVDGGSVDGSLELLRRYEHLRWSSEPDRGQAHAVNEGFARATGTIVGWLNGDDVYEPGALFRVAGAFLGAPGIDVVYGDCFYLYEDSQPHELRLVRARPFDLGFLLDVGCFIPQPAAFVRRSALPAPALDESLRYAMDFDLWAALARAGARFHYLPGPLATFRVTAGSKSGAELARFWPEVRRVSLRHGGRRFSPWYWRHVRGRLATLAPRPYALFKRLWRGADS